MLEKQQRPFYGKEVIVIKWKDDIGGGFAGYVKGLGWVPESELLLKHKLPFDTSGMGSHG